MQGIKIALNKIPDFVSRKAPKKNDKFEKERIEEYELKHQFQHNVRKISRR